MVNAPALHAILEGFYATAVMNFISWNTAYSMFPLTTFVHHKNHLLQPLDDYNASLLVKYNVRGWISQGVQWHEECQTTKYPFQQRRRVGDQFSWRLPLDVTDVISSAPACPDLVMQYANFGILKQGTMQVDTPVPYYRISTTPYSSLMLKHQYLFDQDGWRDFVELRLTELTYMELYKLKKEDRPNALFWYLKRGGLEKYMKESQRHRDIIKGLIQFKKPDIWTYWDHEIPKWYDKYDEWSN